MFPYTDETENEYAYTIHTIALLIQNVFIVIMIFLLPAIIT